MTLQTTDAKGKPKRSWHGKQFDAASFSCLPCGSLHSTRYAKYHLVDDQGPATSISMEWNLPPHSKLKKSGSSRKIKKVESSQNEVPRQVVTRVKDFMHNHKLSQVINERAQSRRSLFD